MQLTQDELFAALGLIMQHIEAGGAHVELTAAVSLAGDVRQAVGNRYNLENPCAADRVRALLVKDAT